MTRTDAEELHDFAKAALTGLLARHWTGEGSNFEPLRMDHEDCRHFAEMSWDMARTMMSTRPKEANQ